MKRGQVRVLPRPAQSPLRDAVHVLGYSQRLPVVPTLITLLAPTHPMPNGEPTDDEAGRTQEQDEHTSY